MIVKQSLRAKVRERLASQVDVHYLAKIQELVPTEWTVVGVKAPVIRSLVKQLRKEYPDVTSADLVHLLDESFADRQREEVLCYIFWLAAMKRHLDRTIWPAIDSWINQIVDWEICDQLATGIAAPLVDKALAAGEWQFVNDLITWTASPNLWRRRFPAAAASALNQKGRAYVAETLQICAPLLADDEPMVRKAVGWALREASKRDPLAVFEFLYQRRQEAHRTLLREGSTKLTDEHRAALLSTDN
jgi:3-methyladenine DNA glycosylase AlkD